MLSRKVINNHPILYNEEWTNSGIVHGFTGTSLNFSNSVLSTSPNLLHVIHNATLVVLDQIHGDTILDTDDVGINTRSVPADGIIISLNDPKLKGFAFGVRTADCLPVMIKKGNRVALLHSGWRGLANGILRSAVSLLSKFPGEWEAIIGPAAGEDDYEVGLEVIEAIGPEAVFSSHPSNNKAYLDTVSTGKMIIQNAVNDSITITTSNISTISNSDFHSFRRDKGNRGSNLAFILAS